MPYGPTSMPYTLVPDEHLPWGADTPHNLFPMQLNPTAKNNGPVHPQKAVNKSLNTGNALQIFRNFARIQTPPPNTYG